jgi:MFS family permease
VSAGNLTSLLMGAALFSMFLFATLYMQQVLGYEAMETGFMWLAFALPAMIASGLSSAVIGRVGVRPLVVTGLTIAAGGLFLFAQIPVDGSYTGNLLAPMLMTAIGFGLAFVSVTVAATLGVREEESGLASGLVNTAQQVGGALGLGIMATLATSRTEDLVGGGTQLPVALTEGFQDAFLAGSAFALIGATIAFVALRPRRERTAVPREAAPQPAR